MTIKEVLLNASPKVGDIVFVAVEGHGGSGKSTLAKLLSEQLNAEVIHTDDFAGWDNPKNWWPQIIERVFDPIKDGATTLSYPRSKWWEDHKPEPVVNQPVTKIMILEGVSSLRKEFAPYISLGIFVDTDKDTCLQRGFERDKGNGGKSDEEIRKMWDEWYRDENEFYIADNVKSRADIILDGTKSFEEQL
jgi:uridine kinase